MTDPLYGHDQLPLAIRRIARAAEAIVNWRTTEKDVDLIVEVTRELGSKLLATAPGR